MRQYAPRPRRWRGCLRMREQDGRCRRPGRFEQRALARMWCARCRTAFEPRTGRHLPEQGRQDEPPPPAGDVLQAAAGGGTDSAPLGVTRPAGPHLWVLVAPRIAVVPRRPDREELDVLDALIGCSGRIPLTQDETATLAAATNGIGVAS